MIDFYCVWLIHRVGVDPPSHKLNRCCAVAQICAFVAKRMLLLKVSSYLCMSGVRYHLTTARATGVMKICDCTVAQLHAPA